MQYIIMLLIVIGLAIADYLTGRQTFSFTGISVKVQKQQANPNLLCTSTI